MSTGIAPASRMVVEEASLGTSDVYPQGRWSNGHPVIVALILLLSSGAAMGDSPPSSPGVSLGPDVPGAAKTTGEKPRDIFSPDWLRASFLAGVTGGLGYRTTGLTFLWKGGYVVSLEHSFVVKETMHYIFAGSEAGYLYREGPHWVSVGAQTGFSIHNGGNVKQRDPRSDDGPINMGLSVAPTFRYRYYWGGYGLEFSLEWPVVIGSKGVSTPWPIVGLGGGM